VGVFRAATSTSETEGPRQPSHFEKRNAKVKKTSTLDVNVGSFMGLAHLLNKLYGV
jgi:hypothetical protein